MRLETVGQLRAEALGHGGLAHFDEWERENRGDRELNMDDPEAPFDEDDHYEEGPEIDVSEETRHWR